MFRLALIAYLIRSWYVFIAWLAAGFTALFVAATVALLMHVMFAGV
jgi:hypothetical protein